MAEPYPRWRYYPIGDRPPEWVPSVVDAFRGAQDQISSLAKKKLNSDSVLKVVRPALEASGFAVETSKKKSDKIRRPVLFGEEGSEALAYEVDAFHPELGIALEVEAGRGALGNADYRDLIQTSLLVDAEYLVLAMALEYHYKALGKPRIFRSYAETHARLDAIYASQRLVLPLSGVLLVGY